jgi:hypothetical protein
MQFYSFTSKLLLYYCIVVVCILQISSSFSNAQVNPGVNRTLVCTWRRFAVEYAKYIQPINARTDWAGPIYDALQVGTTCDASDGINTHPSVTKPQFSSFSLPLHQRPELPLNLQQYPHADEACDSEVFVDTNVGNDNNNGSFISPFKTISRALRWTRGRSSDSIAPCITIRAGTYQMVDEISREKRDRASSNIGAIELTSVDNGLTIRAYQNETVIWSGSRQVTPQWEVVKKFSSNQVIYRTSLPDDIRWDWFYFNEMYINNERAIRARYPDANPSTQGEYTPPNTGYLNDARYWFNPKPGPEATTINVESPILPNAQFSNYEVGLEGPASAFSPPHSFWAIGDPNAGGTYSVPNGVTYNNHTMSPRVATWSRVKNSFAFVFHGGYWGSWMFALDNIDAKNNSVFFGAGGFQESRGFATGGDFYFDHIYEELTSPMEFYINSDEKMVYFMPNITDSNPEPPTSLLISQLPCLLSIRGDVTVPADKITISGITFAHTTNTYMREYEAPSGGDWAIHRGAAVFLQGTTRTIIENNNFTLLGSSAIVVSNYNRNVTIFNNDFAWLGENAIVLIGTTNGIDGISSEEQPTDTWIVQNTIHEVGIYVKQTGPIFQALVRSSRVLANALYNTPRTGININDGFFGDADMSHNLIFNTVRETGDCGGFNTWHRIPYLTLQPTGDCDYTNAYTLDEKGLKIPKAECRFEPTLVPAWFNLHHNLVLNSYNSVWPIDNDDGSSQINNDHNVLLYGGSKNFIGHEKINQNSLYLYVDSPNDPIPPVSEDSQLQKLYRLAASSQVSCMYTAGVDKDRSGWGEEYINNQCIIHNPNNTYNIQPCFAKVNQTLTTLLRNNTYYVPEDFIDRFIIDCNYNGNNTYFTWQQWQEVGQELGSQLVPQPSLEKVVGWARELIMPDSDPTLVSS